jgi:hypothetical protein
LYPAICIVLVQEEDLELLVELDDLFS